MASYQIPQFLDSGDKILGPLNMRQFGYALAGGFLGVMTFSVVQALIPGIGNYAIIPVIPIAAIFAFLALGKYNGRDAEVYVLKFVIYNIKPRQMVYKRSPDVEDLNIKLSQLNPNAILGEWNKRVNEQKAIENNTYLTFNTGDSKAKAEQIKSLGNNVDETVTNSLVEIGMRENYIKSQESVMQALQNQKNSRIR